MKRGKQFFLNFLQVEGLRWKWKSNVVSCQLRRELRQ